ncbi:unnamed protein product [Prorocentrum cordatum]|uniref:Uncharacterized protein n=1 Tax=Prorocentrum cordatum TaxID=2364126 RepID=A0ABN9QUZ9_9DINO|nr:unnamed protein product [Polarella glacialis]
MRPPALRCKAGPRPPPGSPPVHLRKKVKLEPTPPPGPPPAHLLNAVEDPYLLAEPGLAEAKEVEEHDYQQEGQCQQGYQQGYHHQGYQQGQRQQGQDQQGYQQDGDQQGLDHKVQHQKALAEAKEEQAAEPGLAKKEPDLAGFVKAKAKELALLLALGQQGYHQKCQDQQGYQQGQHQKGQCQQQGYQQDGDQQGLDQKAQHQKGQQRGLLAEAKEAAKGQYQQGLGKGLPIYQLHGYFEDWTGVAQRIMEKRMAAEGRLSRMALDARGRREILEADIARRAGGA